MPELNFNFDGVDKFFVTTLIIGFLMVVAIFTLYTLIPSVTIGSTSLGTDTILSDSNISNALTHSPSQNFQAMAFNHSFLVFDGVAGDLVNSTYNPGGINIMTNLTGNLTYSIFFNATSIPPGGVGSCLICQSYPQFSTPLSTMLGFNLYMDNQSNNITLEARSYGLGTSYFISTPNITFGQWHDAALTVNGSNMTLYIDGFNVGTVNLTNRTSSPTLWIGGEAFNSQSMFIGTLDEVRIYNQTVDPTSIANINNSLRQRNFSLPATNLIVWDSFEEQQGTTAFSLGDHRFNGTVLGNVVYSHGLANVTLVNGTDYFQTDKKFNVSNEYFAFTQIRTNYTFGVVSNIATPVADNISSGFGNLSSIFGSVFNILGTVAIVLLLVLVVKATQDRLATTGL